MTKNEFDVLNYVSRHDDVSLSILHKQFAKAFSRNFVMMDLVLIRLAQLGYLKTDPVFVDAARLDPYAVFTLTPAGAHAMDEYYETLHKLYIARIISIGSVVVAIMALCWNILTHDSEYRYITYNQNYECRCESCSDCP